MLRPHVLVRPAMISGRSTADRILNVIRQVVVIAICRPISRCRELSLRLLSALNLRGQLFAVHVFRELCRKPKVVGVAGRFLKREVVEVKGSVFFAPTEFLGGFVVRQ
jgi:hypothetical protein